MEPAQLVCIMTLYKSFFYSFFKRFVLFSLPIEFNIFMDLTLIRITFSSRKIIDQLFESRGSGSARLPTAHCPRPDSFVLFVSELSHNGREPAAQPGRPAVGLVTGSCCHYRLRHALSSAVVIVVFLRGHQTSCRQQVLSPAVVTSLSNLQLL